VDLGAKVLTKNKELDGYFSKVQSVVRQHIQSFAFRAKSIMAKVEDTLAGRVKECQDD
jgi:hypothetical protein